MNATERAVSRRPAWIRRRPVSALMSAVALIGAGGLIGTVALIGAGAAVASSSTSIRSTNNANLGRILEGPTGYTLYVFCPGTSTRCTGHTASRWPALLASGKVGATSGSHISIGKLSTRKLSNGQHQVTYYGQPLYLYKGDHKPGQTHGENQYQGNGAWFVLSTGGRAIPPQSYG